MVSPKVWAHEALSHGAHNRLGFKRGDDDWEAQQWAEESSRVLVIAGTRVDPALRWVRPSEAPDGLRLLLGERDGRTWFAVIVGKEAVGPDWTPLRGLLVPLTDDPDRTAPLVFHALGMAEWLAVTRFCPRCGGPLIHQSSGHELACSSGHVQFPRTDPAVIMLITHGSGDGERCLLGRKSGWPEGRFSTLAGFCEPGESLEDAVRREVAEEAGIVVGEVAYVSNQPWPLPASLMLGFTGVAETTDIHIDTDELVDARWFTRAELRSAIEAGEILLPSEVSISRSLIEGWYGEALPGSW
jgi:NAD+ diphosphatase